MCSGASGVLKPLNTAVTDPSPPSSAESLLTAPASERPLTRPGLPSGQARNTDCEGELWLTRSGRIGSGSPALISRLAGEDRRGLKAFDDQPDAQRQLKERDQNCG